MTEGDFWSRYVHPTLHRPPSRIAWKIQDAHRRGLPDVLTRQMGRTSLLELKYLPNPPGRIRIPWRPAQRAHLVEFDRTGGKRAAFLLLGLADRWILLDPWVKNGPEEELRDRWGVAWGLLDEMGNLADALS